MNANDLVSVNESSYFLHSHQRSIQLNTHGPVKQVKHALSNATKKTGGELNSFTDV